MNKPLAILMRPDKIKDIIGQKHLLGKDQVLSNLIKNKYMCSMIFYGNPGLGKTTLAISLVNTLDLKYRMLNAVINSKKDFDVVIEEAKMFNGLVLIVDEIHRMNKDKQDILLPYLESGLITLIGLTTSNPYHKINPAIRSRCQIFELKPLSNDDILTGLEKVKKTSYLPNLKVDKKVLKRIALLSNGDLRYAYNLLELAYNASSNHEITDELLDTINPTSNFGIDKDEDYHYNTISAFQKSIRGSDVNAALYYLAILLESGDLDIIYRRMSVIAYEDIGLANPSIGPKVDAAINACERLGLPEGRIPLGDIVIEMALSPKSNTGHLAFDEAISDVKKGIIGEIPDNIKQHPKNYLYPHDYPNSWVKQQYLPDKLKNRKYYNPKASSKYEKALMDVYNKINKNSN